MIKSYDFKYQYEDNVRPDTYSTMRDQVHCDLIYARAKARNLKDLEARLHEIKFNWSNKSIAINTYRLLKDFADHELMPALARAEEQLMRMLEEEKPKE